MCYYKFHAPMVNFDLANYFLVYLTTCLLLLSFLTPSSFSAAHNSICAFDDKNAANILINNYD